MRATPDANHYELLEIPADADRSQIERAYRLARATYAEDSLATYSVLDPGEASAILADIERAYRELIDPDTRRRYDASLREEEEEDSADLEIALALETARARPEVPAAPDLVSLDDDDEGPFDGARLRRSRLHRGVELEQIAQVTKINPSYLHFIEEERFDSLPAPVYVRGFVTAYARCLGLDAVRVAHTYMEHFQESRMEPERRLRRRR